MNRPEAVHKLTIAEAFFVHCKTAVFAAHDTVITPDDVGFDVVWQGGYRGQLARHVY